MTARPLIGALALLALAGCGRDDGEIGANQAAPAPAPAAVGTTQLTGLYESADTRPNQMCVIDSGAGNARFGLVVWGAELHSCSGIGEAVRDGNVLRLSMAGDEQCVIEARIDGTSVTLPETAPEGCAYYCGARARLGSASFEKVGDTPQDALRATDLVGDPLCAGMG